MGNNEQKKRGHKWLKVLLILILICGIIFLIAHFSIDSEKPTMKYTSIDYTLTDTKVNIYIDNLNLGTNEVKTLLVSDFSISSNGTPKAAKDINGYETSYSINSRNYTSTITITFGVSESKVDKPITIYYKGQKLSLDQAIKVSI